MNTKKHIFVFLKVICALLLYISCKSESKNNAVLLPVSNKETITIEADISSNMIDVESVFDSSKFLALETSDECLIGEVNKIICHNSNYYILDRTKTKTLFQFDHEGRFVRKFGSKGKGPGEFLEPTDFLITSSNVVILDQFNHKLLFFDLKGNYSHSVPLRYKIHTITLLGNDSLFLAKAGDNRHTDIADYELLVLDTKGEIKMKGLKNPDQMNFGIYCSQQMNSRTIYYRPLINSVYEISDTVIKERYDLKILNSPLPKNFEKLCNGDYENFMKKYRGKYNYFSGQFIETEKYILFSVINTQKQRVTVIYNKDSRKLKSGILEMHGNSGKVGLERFTFFSCGNYLTESDNHIVGYIDSSLIQNKEGDNPVLVFFQLKDF